VLPPLAGVDDLETWMGVSITGAPAIPRAVAILSAASTLVRRFTGATWVDAEGAIDEGDDPVLFEAARQVVVLVAERVWKNPNGHTQEAGAPFSHTIEAWAALGLALRDEEKEMLSTSPGVPGLGVITTTRGPIETGRLLTPCEGDGPSPWYGEI
jgi:hypothetical protein